MQYLYFGALSMSLGMGVRFAYSSLWFVHRTTLEFTHSDGVFDLDGLGVGGGGQVLRHIQCLVLPDLLRSRRDLALRDLGHQIRHFLRLLTGFEDSVL